MSKNIAFAFVFIGGALIGGVVCLLFSTGAFSTSRSSSTTAPRETTTLASNQSGLVRVVDQAAGTVVTVAQVLVPAPGVWVAVREILGSDLGNVLGAAHARGVTSNLVVPLLRETVAGQTYAVVLYRDDGNELFTLDGDSIYIDFETGKPVIALFKTTP